MTSIKKDVPATPVKDWLKPVSGVAGSRFHDGHFYVDSDRVIHRPDGQPSMVDFLPPNMVQPQDGNEE
jgi:hypothetical protein